MMTFSENLEKQFRGRRIIRAIETARLVGVTDVTLHRWERVGSFPKRFPINADADPDDVNAAKGHDLLEVFAWIEARRASRKPAE